jgi:hypothetical protein
MIEAQPSMLGSSAQQIITGGCANSKAGSPTAQQQAAREDNQNHRQAIKQAFSPCFWQQAIPIRHVTRHVT